VTETETDTELITIPGHWDFQYEYFAGASASRFFAELRDHRRIMGVHCPSCKRTLVPARSFCDKCFLATDDWRAIGHSGRVDAFTILATAFPGLPEPPLVIAYVTLEGADTAILNHVGGMDLGDLDAAAEVLLARPGVDVVFAEHRQGRITDFHFELRGA
jgi:uncharacterized OB-fold protein